MGIRRTFILPALAVAALGLTGCVESGPPTPEQLAERFTEPVEPAWEVDVPGIYGEPVVRDGLVFAYADDEEVGMRLTVHSIETGELVWEHTSSPGGARANPLLSSKNAASRPYPLPTIRPLVLERGSGDDAGLVVVFFERDIPETDTIMPDDLLRVADAHTGELLGVTLPEVDPEEFTFDPIGFHDDGDVFANVRSPEWRCGDGQICFTAEDSETFDGYGLIRLDIEGPELHYETGLLAEPEDETAIPDWGPGFAQIIPHGGTQSYVARFEDGAELWRVNEDGLFEVERTSPPEHVEFMRIGDLALIQGYQPILETLEIGQPHTLSLDFATSRTLVAVDAATGEVAWRLPGGDALCHAVHERPVPSDATTIPVCLATDGGYVYDLESGEFLESTEPEVSIVELEVETGETGWEAEGAGVVSLWHVGRLLDRTFASRGDVAVEQVGPDPVLVDLLEGEVVPVPEGATFVCKAEREDVELDFEGSSFAGGGNAITTGYPAGWYHFGCDLDGNTIDTWSRGAVEVAGYGDRDGRMVLPTKDGLIGFDVG